MDKELRSELREIKRLLVLIYAEERNLKNHLYRHLKMEEEDVGTYDNTLHFYLEEELPEREGILIRNFLRLAD